MPSIARADHVGSLLRPQYTADARLALRDGRSTRADLDATLDRAVLEHIELQEKSGIEVISDGEARRTNWIASLQMMGETTYVAPMGGIEPRDIPAPAWFSWWRTNDGKRREMTLTSWNVITKPLTFDRDIVGEEYGFLAQHTDRRKKFTFPSPSYHRIFWDPEHSKDAYPTVDAFLEAVCDWTREHIVRRAIDLGCDYIQMDAPNYGQSYTDPEVMDVMRANGQDLEAELIGDAEIDNALFEGISGVTKALHVCRGNGPGGSWSAAGGYDRFAEAMFPRLTNYDTLLLEYDTPRAGDFSPLKHVLQDTTVVLGLLTTKEPALEDTSLVEQRIREALQFVPLERLALSPQCGFASAGLGNPVTKQEQLAKLQRVVEVARKVWGS